MSLALALVVFGLAVVVAFLQPMAPDTSVYLLHTRTLLETGTRYVESHDNKGPVMVWLTAPAVAALGATTEAAAVLRLTTTLLAAVLLYRILRRTTSRDPGTLAGAMLLGAALPFSALLWGDSLRPELYALVLNATILWAGYRRTAASAFLAAALTAAIVFMKSILALPALLMLLGWLVRDVLDTRRPPWKTMCMMVAGGGLAMAAMLGWLHRHDFLPDWYRQTLEWPAEYRQVVAAEPHAVTDTSSLAARLLALYKSSDDPGRPWLMPIKIPITLLRSQVWPLLLLLAWLLWKQRAAGLPAHTMTWCWLLGVILELGLEHRRWPYPAASLIAPCLVAIIQLAPSGWSDRHLLRRIWLASAILLAGLVWEAARLVPGRWHGVPMSPYEALTGAMRPLYEPGEDVLILDNNVSLYLSLPAPRPHPILAVHAAMVNDTERETLRRHLLTNPPRWLTGKTPAHTGIRFRREQDELEIELVNGELLISGPYQLVLETNGAWARKLASETAHQGATGRP